jgi:hypothetical protein
MQFIPQELKTKEKLRKDKNVFKRELEKNFLHRGSVSKNDLLKNP